MQIILEDEVERSNSGETSSIGFVIRAGRIGRYMEGECDRGDGIRRGRIRVCGRIFNKFEERIQRGRRRVDKSGRAKEVRARRENNGGVCARIQAGRKREWVQGKTISRGVQVRNEQRDQKEIDGGRKSADLHRKLVQESDSAGQKLEGEQERRGEDERKEGRRRSSEAGAETKPAMTFGMAEEATTASAGDNGACSNRRDREDECGGKEGIGARCRGSFKTESLCYGHRLGEELLRLQGIWAHGLQLQESGTEGESGR